MSKRPLMVWHLCSNRWNSAITEYALSAARALALGAHRQLFIAGRASPAAQRAAEHLQVRTLAGFGLAAAPELLALAKVQAPDVVLTYGGPETFLARLIKLRTGAKVWRFQGQAVGPAGRATARLRHRLGHSHVDLLLTPSDKLRAVLQAYQTSRPVVCVPLGCDEGKYQPVPAAWAAQAGGRPTMTLLGRLDPVKGHQRALAIMAAMLKRWPSDAPRPLLHIIGEPANLSVETIVAAVAASGLRMGEDVRLTPTRVQNLAEVLSQTTLGIIPSLDSEIICRVAEEFLLCGTPVAVSGVGSLQEVLFPDAGFSFLGASTEAAAALFAHWLATAHKESPAARAARARVARQRFSLSAMGERLAGLIDQQHL